MAPVDAPRWGGLHVWGPLSGSYRKWKASDGNVCVIPMMSPYDDFCL